MKNSNPFAYLRKRNAKAVRKKSIGSSGSCSQTSSFLHLNGPQRGVSVPAAETSVDMTPGQRMAFRVNQRRGGHNELLTS